MEAEDGQNPLSLCQISWKIAWLISEAIQIQKHVIQPQTPPIFLLALFIRLL